MPLSYEFKSVTNLLITVSDLHCKRIDLTLSAYAILPTLVLSLFNDFFIEAVSEVMLYEKRKFVELTSVVLPYIIY